MIFRPTQVWKFSRFLRLFVTVNAVYILFQTFEGVNSNDYKEMQYLVPAIIARFVRLQPRTWTGTITFMWELYGYKYGTFLDLYRSKILV